MPEAVAGHKVGVMPGHRILWIEGHPAVEGLAAPTTLREAEGRVLAALDKAGLPTGRDGGIGRLDQTVTLRFEDRLQGLAFLSGVAHAEVPRVKPVVFGRPPETVWFLGARSRKTRVLARIYDKGLESNTAPRGELIRLENQTRYSKGARMRAAMHDEAPELAGSKFERRFAPLAESCDGVHAASLPVLARRIGELVADGEMTSRQAERLGGYLLLQGEGGPRYSPSTRRRRRRELRTHGLVLADPLADPVDVDLGAALDEALAAWSRG